MKILFVLVPALNPFKGGVQRITYNLGKFFHENNIEVFYFSFSINDHIDEVYGKLYHASYKGLADNSDNVFELQKLLQELNVDIVINQMPYEKKIRKALFKNKEKLQYKLIACIHNSLFCFKENVKNIALRELPSPFNKLMATNMGTTLLKGYHRIKHGIELRDILRGHDYCLLFTPPNHEELRYFVGDYKVEKIGYMPNPVSTIKSLNTKKEKIILHVGRINIPQKRSDLLLDFWKKVFSALPDWRFIIIGDGPYREELERDLQQQNLPNMQIMGYQNPEPYYERASLFMMPSAYEGFPNTILEAHSYGCPVLAFDSYAALRWIVNDGKDALLSQPFDTRQMAEHAIMLARNEKRLYAMQKAAIENAKRFTIERVGQLWIDIFQKRGCN
ncbi:glycosyltransferase [Calditrichota bacterium GD2]